MLRSPRDENFPRLRESPWKETRERKTVEVKSWMKADVTQRGMVIIEFAEEPF